MFKTILSAAALVFGVVGTIVCLVILIGIWVISARLRHVAVDLASAADDVFTSADQRLVSLDERLVTLQSTTIELDEAVKQWDGEELKQAVAEQFDVQGTATSISEGLQKSDQWLAATEDSVELLQRILKTAKSLGLEAGAVEDDAFLKELSTLRARVTQARSTVEDLSQRASGGIDDAHWSPSSAFSQLAARLVVTLADIDSSVETVRQKLSRAREAGTVVKSKTVRLIWIGSFAATVLMIWLLAGQIALCSVSWNAMPRESTPLLTK